LQVGAGQTGARFRLPPGSAVGLAQRVGLIARAVFTHGYVDAMRATLVMPLAMMLLAAASCLLIRQRKVAGSQQPARPAEEKAPA